MTWSKQTLETTKALRSMQAELNSLFAHREESIMLMTLALVCQEHVLLLGPPGTGKTELVTRFAGHLDLQEFHYLLTRFTEPAEIFGPLDIKQFGAGTYHVRTDGMLPQAQLTFLDEVFQGSSAILNTLLTIVHERRFHNGPIREPVPLLTLVGATNQLPEEPGLRAFSDRFTLRTRLDPVPDDALDDLLDHGWDLEQRRMRVIARAARGEEVKPVTWANDSELRSLHEQLTEVRLGEIRGDYSRLIRDLRAEGVELSDRRTVKGLKMVAGAALMRSAEQAEVQDLWPLCHMWSRLEDAEVIRRAVEPLVADGGGPRPGRAASAEELDEELNLLVHSEADLVSEASVSEHLMRLNRLRRAVLVHHGDNLALRTKTEDAVERVLAMMGKIDV